MPHCDTPSEGLRLSSFAQIHAGLLRAQIATGAELEIRAPAAVLSSLVPLCDGTRSFGQIQSELEARLSWPKTTEFLHALVNQGVLRGTPPGRRMTSPLSAASTALVVDVRPMHDELPAAVTQVGFKLACATFASPGLERIKGFGRAMSDEVAGDIARSEAAERHAYFRPAQTARVGTAREIGNCMDPRTCVQYSRAQYQRPTLGVHCYDPAAEHSWVPARTLDSNEQRWCHAELVYSAHALNGGRAPSALTWQTTSGCASDVDFSRAVERAGLEVIERDAFVRHWLAQEPAVSIRL
ncbi:MAG: YcaO-like family protein, partial [Bordetella sp.]|nr:YcaO-like family protein [Bordetella sp.]